MKIKFILLSFFFLTLIQNYTLAQLPPFVSGQPSSNNVNTLAKSSWYRGGNLGPTSTVTSQGDQNVFGTLWNSPIYTYTNSLARMKLNGSLSYAVNGFNQPRNGYLLLGNTVGPNAAYMNSANLGAFSMLHLAGQDGFLVQEGGHRPWMKTGITFTDNNDMSYFGLRTIQSDLTETVLSWSEIQSNVIPPGQDDMAFRFIGGNEALVGPVQSYTDLDGLHIARFTGFGHFALGNTFGVTAGGGGYVRPQSHFHISHHAYNSSNIGMGFMQITYRDLTEETDIDGLRFGIDVRNGITNSYLRWQEKSAFIVQTDWNDVPGGIQDGERLRVTSTNALGVPDPADTLDGNITRVAISHNGDQPVTAPRSLLHLGYNTGANSIFNTTDGWRDWMDIGTFTGSGTDHMYVGLKDEGNDSLDAIINWGDNQTPGATPNGPDNLRFIFTSTTTALTGQGDSISQSNDGLEIARMYPDYDTTFTYGGNFDAYGRMGIGDFTAQGVNENPTHKLDVIGNGRFRYLPDSLYIADSTVQKYVMVDSAGVLRWSSVAPSGFGAACSDSVNAKLQFDTKVDLNNHNLYFVKNDSIDKNYTGFGYDCGTVLPAKVSVFQDHTVETTTRTEAISGVNNDSTITMFNEQIGVYGQSTHAQNVNIRPINVAGDFSAGNAVQNFGVRVVVSSPLQNDEETNIGVQAIANDADAVANHGGVFQGGGNANNSGIWANAIGDQTSPNGLSYGAIGHGRYSLMQNVGVLGRTDANFGGTGGTINTLYGAQQNFGVAGYSGGANLNIGVYGEAGTNALVTNYAGYFTGTTVNLGAILIASDSTLKENIAPISNNTDSLFMLIQPKQYEFINTGNAARMGLPDGVRYGVLAQQVASLFPELIKTVTHPAELDSVGNIVNPSFEFKAVDLEQMIPLLIQNSQKQNERVSSLETQVASLQSENDDLNNRLTSLENCLSGILPMLCQMNNSTIEQTNLEVQNELIKTINIELSNKDNIVLNQNVPNPFAESTVITFSIPESVQKAQIHFYDGTGKLINSVVLVERGSGRLNVFANDLSSGIYTYSLVADGQVVSTKRMMKD